MQDTSVVTIKPSTNMPGIYIMKVVDVDEDPELSDDESFLLSRDDLATMRDRINELLKTDERIVNFAYVT